MKYSEQREAVNCGGNEENCHQFDEWITPEGIAVVSMNTTGLHSEQHSRVNQSPFESVNFVKES